MGHNIRELKKKAFFFKFSFFRLVEVEIFRSEKNPYYYACTGAILGGQLQDK